MTFKEWWDENKAYIRADASPCYDKMKKAWEASAFALNSELGVAANEGAKKERLEAAMLEITRTDMVPLPVDKIRAIIIKAMG